MSIDSKRMFRCCLCGGDVRMATGTGRTYRRARTEEVQIPDNLELATCGKCGEWYWGEDTSEALERAYQRAILSPVLPAARETGRGEP